jgi:hypothetical protein
MRTTTISTLLWWVAPGAIVLALGVRAVVSPYRLPAPAPHLGPLTVTPAQVTLTPENDSPSVTIVGSGLPPNASLEFDLVCQTCGTSAGATWPAPLVTPGNNPRTDARGVVHWSGHLLLQTAPGTYAVEARALHGVVGGQDSGGTLARGTLTMRG